MRRTTFPAVRRPASASRGRCLTRPAVLLADEVDARASNDDNADKVASIMASAAAGGMAIVRIRHRPPDGRATRIVTLSSGRLS